MKLFGYISLLLLLRTYEAERMPVAAARRLLEKMNRDVDPCENFYEYACGGFLANNEVEPDDFRASTLGNVEAKNDGRLIKLLSERIRLRDSSPVKKAKIFYQFCLNQDEIEANAKSQILEFINAEGGSWPTFNSSWDENEFDLELSMAAANRIYTIDSGSVGPLIRMLVFRGISPEFQIALPMQTAVFGLTVGDLMDFPGTFDWMKFLTNIFRETDYTVKESDPVFVNVDDFYKAAVPALNSASKRVVANLIKWRMFQSLVRASPAAIIRRTFQERVLISGQEEDLPRERFCAKIVNGNWDLVPDTYGMSQIVARMLIDRYYMRREKLENSRIAQLEEEELQDILRENDWLSEETKTNLILKFEINEDSYAKNFISTVLGNTRRSLENLLYPERFKWIAAPSIVNGVMALRQPQLIVTAALLQDPYYDLSFPWAIKYGAGGFIIAHEFTHLIGTNTNIWNEDGVFLPLSSYLSDTSLGILAEEKLSCLVNQYNQYDVPYTDGLMVNGVISLEENLADNVGLKIAYLTYDTFVKKYGERRTRNLPFTARELFFIGFAQDFCEKRRPEYATIATAFGSYSPGKWRINGPLRNLTQFSEVFKCSADSFMNPEERCPVY